MTLRRTLAFASLAVAMLVIAGPPAVAHEEFSPPFVPPGRPVFVTLSAANERASDLTTITITAPPGGQFGVATRQPPGWTVERSVSEITWSGGRVPPQSFESWGFELDALDQPGTLSYEVRSSFADGSSDSHEVELAVVSADEPVISTAPTAAPTTTLAPGSPATTEPTPTIPRARATSGEATAATALIFSILAGLVGGAALIVALRRRPGHSTITPDKPSGPDKGGQDW